MVRTKASHHQPIHEPNRMRLRLRHPVRLAPLILPEARLRQHHQRLQSVFLPDVRNHRSQLLLPLPLSCRNLQAVMWHPVTSAPRQTTSLLLSLEGTRRTSAHRNHHRNKLHTIHNTTQMLTSGNSHLIPPRREASTVTASRTHTLSPLSPHLSSLRQR